MDDVAGDFVVSAIGMCDCCAVVDEAVDLGALSCYDANAVAIL